LSSSLFLLLTVLCCAVLWLLHCVCLTQGDEWEEKWDEHYHSSGKVAKYADKWGKAGGCMRLVRMLIVR
jgi:hypothetical protein